MFSHNQSIATLTVTPNQMTNHIYPTHTCKIRVLFCTFDSFVYLGFKEEGLVNLTSVYAFFLGNLQYLFWLYDLEAFVCSGFSEGRDKTGCNCDDSWFTQGLNTYFSTPPYCIHDIVTSQYKLQPKRKDDDVKLFV